MALNAALTCLLVAPRATSKVRVFSTSILWVAFSENLGWMITEYLLNPAGLAICLWCLGNLGFLCSYNVLGLKNLGLL